MCYKVRSDSKPMNMCRAAVALLVLMLATGCARIPDTFSPPEQRQPVTGEEPSGLRNFVRVNEPGADAHFLKDINTFVEGGHFRWTQQNPTFQFQLAPRPSWKLKVDFALHSAVLSKTGPITITYFINGRKFDQATYAKDGEQHYEKLVPASSLSTGSPTLVSLQLDKVLETPDHNKLGLILTAAGFVE